MNRRRRYIDACCGWGLICVLLCALPFTVGADTSEATVVAEANATDMETAATDAATCDDDDAVDVCDDTSETELETVSPTATAHPLDLIDAQQRALADNPSLAAGAERVKQVQQMVTQARSMYYPQIDLNYTYSFSWLPKNYTDSVSDSLDQLDRMLWDWRKDSITTMTRSGVFSLRDRRNVRSFYRDAQRQIDSARDYIDDPLENTTLNVTMGWLLFDGFARELANAMARYGYGEAQAGFREGQRILLDAVAQAYYGAQIAREQIAINKSDIAFNERLLKEAQGRREAGRGTTSHVLSFETLLYAARANLLRAERDYEMALIALALLIGMPNGRLGDGFALAPLEEETPETMMMPDADAMLSLAYAYRPDLEQSELGLKRAQASVRREYAKFAPQIAAVGMLETANVNETGISADRVTTTVGINASMNLFSGGRRRSEVIEAKHARREAEWRIAEKEQEIVSDVNQALLDLRTAQDALKLQREAAESVRRNRDLTEMEYNAGKEMLVTLSQAQRDYMQAKGMLAQARVNLQRTWQALHAATGVNIGLLSQGESNGLPVLVETKDEYKE